MAAVPVESAIAASVEPERDAVGYAGTVGAALWRGFLAANFDLQGDTGRIPCEANVREVREPVGGREIVDAIRFGQMEERIFVHGRNQVGVAAGVGETEQEARGDERHAGDPEMKRAAG